MYIVRKCRCERCRSWASLYKKGKIKYSGITETKLMKPYSKEIVHGTLAGYKKEQRLGLLRCRPCKDAYSEYMRNRRKTLDH